ncbi:AAA family ATPase [Kiloniella sp. b19]|uniref:AAA family ATPase n=1 Tax=Kiloniella sp. GXU_MW_B19 TaxID=3141326 RepID=UPI0031D064CA
MKKGTLVLFCGKMGAGKTTKAREITLERGAVLLSEDEWLAALYPDQISTLADYSACSGLLKTPIRALVQSVLSAGVDVVMDFPANTLSQRTWLRSLCAEVEAPHELFYLDFSDERCLAQIAKRRLEQPDRAKTDTPGMFHLVTGYFEEPSPEEGFHLIRISEKG